MFIGIDVGGTHSDGVLLAGKKILNRSKLVTDKNNLLDTVLHSLDRLLKGVNPAEISRVNLSTTISTNAIVEHKTPPVGLIIQKGPGVSTDFSSLKGDIRYISGYVDHRGKLVKTIDKEEVQQALKDFKQAGLQHLAIVSKFSPRNHKAEEAIADLAKQDFAHCSLGYRISGKLNFPRRVNSTYYNAAVHDTFAAFAREVRAALAQRNIEAEVNILKADGGTMSLQKGVEQPVQTILSGPAASFMGILALLPNEEDAVLLDIGGTTSDIFFVVQQSPLFESLGAEIAGEKTLVRAVFAQSIGCGGDSRITYSNNKLYIGPEREGPAVALGGPALTPTDAFIVLDKLQIGDQAKAYKAMSNMAANIGLEVEETAELILRQMALKIKREVQRLLAGINAKPLFTVREVLENRRLVPREIRLIGGPAKLISPFMEECFDLPCHYPEDYAIANAIGAALAIPSLELNLIADTGRGVLSIPELDIYENISSRYTLREAKERILAELSSSPYPAEIVEAESFNMIEGYRHNFNIRIKAQLKPGLEGVLYES